MKLSSITIMPDARVSFRGHVHVSAWRREHIFGEWIRFCAGVDGNDRSQPKFPPGLPPAAPFRKSPSMLSWSPLATEIPSSAEGRAWPGWPVARFGWTYEAPDESHRPMRMDDGYRQDHLMSIRSRNVPSMLPPRNVNGI